MKYSTVTLRWSSAPVRSGGLPLCQCAEAWRGSRSKPFGPNNCCQPESEVSVRGQRSALMCCCCFRKGELTDQIFYNTCSRRMHLITNNQDGRFKCLFMYNKNLLCFFFFFFTVSLFYRPKIHPRVYSHEKEESADKSSTLMDGFMM